MRFSLALRLLSLCLAFGLLFGTSLPSFASSGLYVPTGEDIEMFLEGFEPEDENDITSGLGVFFDEYLPVSLGIVNDDTGTTSFSIRYYAGQGLGGWSSETNWTTSSDIAINKTFALNDILDGYPSTGVPKPNNVANGSYFDPAIGYTISFLRGDNGNIPKGSKIAINLTFNDIAVDNTAVADLVYTTSSGGYFTRITGASNYYYSNLGSNLMALNHTGNTSYVPYATVVGFDQEITVGGLTADGENIVFTTFNNMENLVYDLNVTEEVQYIYIDVEYVGKSLNTAQYDNNLIVPYVYNFDLSGSVELDDSGVISGLISGIIEWLRSILDAILELPDKIVNGIKSVLQELFVPSPDFISGKFEEFKLLAESKLGFLFTMLDMVVDLFTTLSTNISEPMETLTIPRLALPFPYVDSGELVLWEDMTFDVFPDGLDVLLNLVHLVTSIVLITATINFAVNYIRRFFEKG